MKGNSNIEVQIILTNSDICEIRSNFATFTHNSSVTEIYRNIHIKNTG